ncbi:hypothetical protein mRhiFer1_008527 [Rhinolophus ferrumequinum]|uniref:Uncharacterized protein n=1 Tax=Rhinolophus ferrumequinum TaxID=59479 RepID=A0A7J7UXJ4_RHIFE|nr:hypothetical protein mRhiFer1_008527 [Rhinolophus ferrumequinum]
MDGVSSPECPRRGWATKEAQDKLTVTSRERRAEASSNGGLKDSGRGSLRRTWWLGQTRASEDSPQALRAWPSSPWPPRLPLRGANPPSPSLWDRVSGSLPLLPGRAQSGLASATGKLPGFLPASALHS